MQDNQISTQLLIEGNQAIPKFTNGSNAAPQKSYFGKFILLVCITVGVVVLFSYIIGKARQERFAMLEAKKKLEAQTARLETMNASLEKERIALKNDPTSIEREARNRLGFILPDEVVYPKQNFKVKSVAKEEQVTVATRNRWKAFLLDGPFPWQVPTLIILIATAYFLITYHIEYRKLHQSDC